MWNKQKDGSNKELINWSKNHENWFFEKSIKLINLISFYTDWKNLEDTNYLYQEWEESITNGCINLIKKIIKEYLKKFMSINVTT